MKKRRKIVSLVLVFIMMLSVFATSGGLSFADETDIVDDTENIITATATDAEETAVDEANTDENLDFTELVDAISDVGFLFNGIDLSVLNDEELTNLFLDDVWYEEITDEEVELQTGLRGKKELDSVREIIVYDYTENNIYTSYETFLDIVDEVILEREFTELPELIPEDIPINYSASNPFGGNPVGTTTLYTGEVIGYAYYSTNYMSTSGTPSASNNNAYCINPSSSTPRNGSSCDMYEVWDGNLRKIMYYSAGAPGYRDNSQYMSNMIRMCINEYDLATDSIILTHLALSKLSGDPDWNYGLPANTWEVGANNYISNVLNMSAPPASFHLYYLVDRNSGTQGVMTWRVLNTGSLEIKKTVNNAPAGTTPVDLTGIKFHVHKSTNSSNQATNVDTATEVATFVCDSAGNTKVVYVNPSYASSGSVNTGTLTGLATGDYVIFEDTGVWNTNNPGRDFERVTVTNNDNQTVKTSFALTSTINGNYDASKNMGYGTSYAYTYTYGSYGAHPQYYCTLTIENVANLKKEVIANNWYDDKSLKLKKSSANDITAGNNCYSLAGATYAVYDYRWHDSAEAATEDNYTTKPGYIGALVCDASGDTNTISGLLEQPYYVKEVIAPPGYKLDNTVHTCNLADSSQLVDNTYTLRVTDPPILDPLDILVKKVDANGNGLAGAQFTIKFYEGQYNDGVDPATLGKTPNRTYIVETKSDGWAYTRDEYRAPNDLGYAWYKDPNTNQVQFPLGTATVQETKAPDNYFIDSTVYVRRITGDGNTNTVNVYNAPTVSDTPKANVRINKYSTVPTITGEDNSYSLAGAVYVAYTDEDSARRATELNYYNLAGYVGAMTTDASGVSNTLTELEPKTYYVKEVKASPNFNLDATVHIVDLNHPEVYAEHTCIVDSFEKPKLYISTSASDIETNDRVSGADTEVTVKDVCSYKGLTVGESYTLKGVIMLKSTNSPLLVNGSQITMDKTFTANTSVGTVDMTFPTFNGTNLNGESIVIYQRLYNSTNDLVAEHTDINSIDQTIAFVDVKTTASDIDTNDNVSNADAEVTITDKVSCTNLIVGKEYTIKGVIMDKATNAPLLINGAEIRAVKTFTATEVNPVVDVTFPTFDGSALAGTSVVVFETMYHNNIEVAKHTDITDKEQEITFVEIKTTASDIDTNDNVSNADAEVTITDKVNCTNLIVGKEYTVKGVIMDKATNAPLLINGAEIRAEKTFTATEANPVVDVTFPTFDGSALAGKSVVVFETMYHNNIEVAKHTDITDKEQEITFVEIKTTASDIDTNDNVSNADAEVTITDKVSCTNLIVGKEYTVKGVIMDKATNAPLLINGAEIRAEKTFTATEANPVVDITFPTFDGSALAGTSVVVFETMYHNNIEVAKHTDITDKEQEISFPEVHTTAYGKRAESNVKNEVVVTDKVEYKNLLVNGKEYTVRGILMRKDTNKPLLNENGMPIVASKTFVPTEKDGFIEIEFVFDAELLNTAAIVCFEYLEYEGILVGSHAEITDLQQTVLFPCVYKVDSETEKAVSGAELALYDKDNNLLDSWITDGGVHILSELSNGTYTLRELKAPKGYDVFADIEFEVKGTEETYVITAKDDVIKGTVNLIKVDDKDADKKLSGVTFNLYKTADSVIDTSVDMLLLDKFNMLDEAVKTEINGYKILEDDLYVGTYTTDEDGVIVVDGLVYGQYYFIETETQKGYNLVTDDIGFIINDEERIAEVEVSNEGRIGWIKYSVSVKDAPGSNGGHHKTGDSFKLMLYVVMGISALLGMVVILIKKKSAKWILFVPIALTVFCANTIDSYAAEETYTETKEDTYDTDDESKYNMGFENEIEVNGVKYELEGIEYEKENQYDKQGLDIKESIDKVYDEITADYEPPKSIEQDGYTYELKDYNTEVVGYIPVELNSSIDTEFYRSEPEHQATLTYTYTDEKTKESYTVELPYMRSEVISSGYVIPITITGTLYDYSAEYFMYNGKKYNNPKEDLSGIEDILLGYVDESGYDKEEYKNLKYGYSGEAYTNNDGILCRDFYVSFDVYGEKYRFYYGDSYDELVEEKSAKCVYVLDSASATKLDTLKNTFDVVGTANYKVVKVEKKKNFLQTTVGKAVLASGIIFIILIIVALAVYIIKGGRKDTDYVSKRDAIRDFNELNK